MPYKPKSHAQRMAESRPRPKDDRANATDRGYDSRWRRIRKAYLSRHPLCIMCERAGVTCAAELVDHILPLADGGSHAWANLQPLCRDCHAKKTAGDLRRRRG